MQAEKLLRAPVFRQRFSSTPRGARLARLLAVQQLADWGVPHGSDASDAVALVVGELAANAVTHGRLPGRDFEVRLVRVPGRLWVAVTDARGDTRPSPAAPGAASDAEAGRGLALVAAVALRWGVAERRPGPGKTVWAQLCLPGGPVDPC
ncbi:ATP-binding protein [Streptomyces sp. ACA25]|uniref:ATP-binding protein n=1 Tax=Streptomyces sp. ACA25 TaxID=3022596 RepID=UPI00230703D2|nr:ATP-binding protein [Streptomyces sp. ACA25]MDB1088179.1 ATP-binding protein [Streptomyces sp. ACA25]